MLPWGWYSLMQTFLPYQSFTQSAQALDPKRLGKQRVEAMQILKALTLPTYGWKHHPAVKMWKGHEKALKAYYNIILSEWVLRGYNNSMQFIPFEEYLPYTLPTWITPEFCLSHQSNLIRKDAECYRPIFGNEVPDNLPYVWPVR